MFLPSAFTSIDPGATNFVLPCVFADTMPPPVPWLATSGDGWLMKYEPLMAIFLEHRKPNADRRCPSRRPGKIAERQGRA